MALSPDSDAFYVQFSDGDYDYFSYSAESFRQALNDSSTPSVVALGPRSAWYVGWPDGRWQSNGLPRSLLHRCVAFTSISGLDISPKDDSRDSDDDSRSPSEDEGGDVDTVAWFIRWGDERNPPWKLKIAPSSLSETVEEVHQNGGRVRSIEFGSFGDWVLRCSD